MKEIAKEVIVSGSMLALRTAMNGVDRLLGDKLKGKKRVADEIEPTPIVPKHRRLFLWPS